MQNTDGICHMKAKFTMTLMLKKIDHFCHIPTTEFIAEPAGQFHIPGTADPGGENQQRTIYYTIKQFHLIL